MENRVLASLPPEIDRLKKAPQRLWYRGNPELLKRRKVSIVGTRRPSAYTREMTHRLASELAARGVVVVSGAAMGVDAIAHQGAGAASTIAVLGTGVDLRYPAVNVPLIEGIEAEGLLLSRFEPGMRATNWSFVVRNELVVALGEVLVITQADRDGSSMRSAEIAKKLGKEIWVLPQRLGESEGTNALLKEKTAEAIYSLEDFADRFGTVPAADLPRDEFFYFCQNFPTVDEVLSRFGERLYEAELMGEVVIENGKVRLA